MFTQLNSPNEFFYDKKELAFIKRDVIKIINIFCYKLV